MQIFLFSHIPMFSSCFLYLQSKGNRNRNVQPLTNAKTQRKVSCGFPSYRLLTEETRFILHM